MKTIYRYIEKLSEIPYIDRSAIEGEQQKKGLVIEVGQRMTENSRTVETLYGPAAKVFFYEGPQVMEEWNTPESKEKLSTMSKLTAVLLERDVDEAEYKEFALDFLRDQDKLSSKMIRDIKNNPELVELIKSVPPNYLGKMIFLATDLAIMWDKAQK